MKSEIGDGIPVVGIEFEYLDAVIEFCNNYTRRVGFDWRNRSSKKNADEVVYYVILVYNQEGRTKSKKLLNHAGRLIALVYRKNDVRNFIDLDRRSIEKEAMVKR
ncbi:hypothetical protein AHAS_Ahas20G0137900 [Arachis hypogaea]|uniref:FAR1 domain-containing protein n=1 Tax=Arachis hypogaea TaxID=3818 RepID=A0A444X1S7_ARAHY|nr:hypothetical protein Ahy_B10g102282 [Arachis hypogaea]